MCNSSRPEEPFVAEYVTTRRVRDNPGFDVVTVRGLFPGTAQCVCGRTGEREPRALCRKTKLWSLTAPRDLTLRVWRRAVD